MAFASSDIVGFHVLLSAMRGPGRPRPAETGEDDSEHFGPGLEAP
jgi:hypothetical protein